jgi:hypothetical protein
VTNIPTDERSALWVTCDKCKHRWIGLYLPMALMDAAKAMGRLTCPMCANTRIMVSPSSIETGSADDVPAEGGK